MNLLLVEDDVRITAFMTKGLRAGGHAVEAVATGGDALQRLGGPTPPYRLVLLDLGLPDMDGLEVLRLLRAGGAIVPVIVVTARSDAGARRQSEQLGAAAYLVKPFPFAELLAHVRDSAVGAKH